MLFFCNSLPKICTPPFICCIFSGGIECFSETLIKIPKQNNLTTQFFFQCIKINWLSQLSSEDYFELQNLGVNFFLVAAAIQNSMGMF